MKNIILILLLWGSLAVTGRGLELELLEAFPIVGPRDFEPSGLCLVDGVLFTVSDKDDTTIYRLEFADAVARAVPHLSVEAPEAGALDFEGIVADGSGGFFLACEKAWRVLHVGADGESGWAGPEVRATGKAVGLFARSGGDIEGLCRLPDGSMLLAAEREPRGFLHLTLDPEGGRVEAWVGNETRHASKLPKERTPDWADLYAEGDQVYALFRNAHLIVRLEHDGERWLEGAECWSFAETENSPLYRYRDARYGHAEGLTMDDARIFVVLDNNRSARVSGGGAGELDQRPLLFVFRRP